MGAGDKKQVNKCLYSSLDALLYFILHGKKKLTQSLISSPNKRRKESKAWGNSQLKY